MPMPGLVDPREVLSDLRVSVPLDAQEASYLAASARISSFSNVLSMNTCVDVLTLFYFPGRRKRAWIARRLSFLRRAAARESRGVWFLFFRGEKSKNTNLWILSPAGQG